MAKKQIHNEEIALSIYINSSPAQKEILDLEKKNRELIATQKELNASVRSLEKEDAKLRKAYENTVKQLSQLSKEKSKLNKSYDDEVRKLKELEASVNRSSKTSVEKLEAQKRAVKGLEEQKKKLAVQEANLTKAEQALYQKVESSTKAVRAAQKERKLLNNEIQQNSAKIGKLTNDLKLSEMTTAQLTKKSRELRQILSQMADSPARRKLAAELGEVNAQMARLNGQAKIQQLSWSSAANWLNKYQTILFGFIATLTGVSFTIQKWLDYSGKLKDQQADVMKTTGMSAEAVDELTRSIGQLETRTSRLDLLKIAEEGGRIGIAAEEMEDFVEVMNRASVALGDSFTGGVEEVSSVLGKLKFLFDETKDMGVDLAYNAIGSALNNLGASGVATERNIAEFATRLGSLPQAFKPSIAESLALGATFEESGIQAEVASRAYSIFLNRAAKNTEEFARVMGMSVDEARELINTNPVEFFLQFGEALSKSKISATQMSQMLQDMGINADGANKIIGAISNNSKRFRQQINLSNKSMADATSLLDEYRVKNENLPATLEKISKKLSGLFTSENILKGLEDVVYWFGRLVGATEDVDGSGKKWREGLLTAVKVLAILTAGIISYNGAMKLQAIWTARATAGSLLWNAQLKIQNALAAISVIRIGLMTAAKALFTKGVKAAIAELRVMNAVLGFSPWGAVAAAIGIAASAIYAFRSETKKAITQQQLLNSVNAEAEKSISDKKKEIELLLKVAKDETIEKGKRIVALEKLNDLMHGYSDLLTIEKINTLEAKAATEEYTKALEKNARVKALQTKYNQLESQKLDVQQKTSKDYDSKVDGVFRAVWEFFGIDTGGDKMLSAEQIEKQVRDTWKGYGLTEVEIQKKIQEALIHSGVATQQKELDEIVRQQKILEDELTKLYTETLVPTKTDDEPEFTYTESGKDNKKERERRINELIKENEQLTKELLQIRRNYEDAHFNTLESSFQKELDMLAVQHERRIQDLEAQLVDERVLEDLEREKRNSKGDSEKIRLIDQLIGQIKEKNLELNNAILQSEITFGYQVGRVHAEYGIKKVNELQKGFEAQKKEREKAYNEELLELGSFEEVKERLKDTLSAKELAQIKTWEDAKKALRAEYDKAALDQEIELTKQLLYEMEQAWATGQFGEFNLELMTEEEKLEMLDYIEELKAKLTELGVLKINLQNGNTEGSLETYGFGGKMDILGMTQENWLQFFDNIQAGIYGMSEVIATVGLMQNAFQMFFAAQQQGYQREMQHFDLAMKKKHESLKRQLDHGVISQEQYDKKVKDLEEKAEKRREELNYQQAIGNWRRSIVEANSAMALGIMNALSLPPPKNFIYAGMVAAMSGYQLANILQNKPIKGFEDGFYSNLFPVTREQDGKKFNAHYGGTASSGLVNRPTVFMAGENGVEMILDSKTYKTLPPDIAYGLHQHIARVKGFEGGYYPETNTSSTDSDLLIIADLLQTTNELMAQNNFLLSQIQETEKTANLILDFEAMRKIKKVSADYDRHLNQNKV